MVASDEPLPAGPYPGDSLKWRSSEVVEFVTAPGQIGVWTDRWVASNDHAVFGAAVLTREERDAVVLAFRFPGDDSPELRKAILDQFVSDFTIAIRIPADAAPTSAPAPAR